VQTIREIGSARELDDAVADAFRGAGLPSQCRRLLRTGDAPARPAAAAERAELSDGTLRYVLLVAALLSPRPARTDGAERAETSLHPDLLARWRA